MCSWVGSEAGMGGGGGVDGWREICVPEWVRGWVRGREWVRWGSRGGDVCMSGCVGGVRGGDCGVVETGEGRGICPYGWVRGWVWGGN